MPRPVLSTASVAVALVTLAACASGSPEPTRTPGAGAPSASPQVTVTPEPSVSASPGAVDSVVGTVVRFTSERMTVDVTVGEDSPGVRDFLSMLPLELTIEEFGGREKIAYLPRELAHDGSPGSDPEDGDLIYYTPWGNLGFYYDASGIVYSDSTLHIGTYSATAEQLALLEGDGVTVEVVG